MPTSALRAARRAPWRFRCPSRASNYGRVIRLRTAYGLKHRRTRLLEAGLLTPDDVATRFGVKLYTVHLWRRRGLLRAHPVNDRGDYLYEIPAEDLPAKFAHKRTYQVEPRSPSSRNVRGAV